MYKVQKGKRKEDNGFNKVLIILKLVLFTICVHSAVIWEKCSIY